MTRDYSNKPCVGLTDGTTCASGGKKGKNQLTQLRCFKCNIAQKKLIKSRNHERRVQGSYALAPGEYDLLYQSQDGVCALCKKANGKARKLSVDHDHKLEVEGQVTRESIRGLLCKRENYSLLGMFGDDPEFYRKVIKYLESPPAQQILNREDNA